MTATHEPRLRTWPLRLTWVAFLFTRLLVFSSIPLLRWRNVARAKRLLADAVAEADRLDPGWREARLEKTGFIIPQQSAAQFAVLEAAWTMEPPREVAKTGYGGRAVEAGGLQDRLLNHLLHSTTVSPTPEEMTLARESLVEAIRKAELAYADPSSVAHLPELTSFGRRDWRWTLVTLLAEAAESLALNGETEAGIQLTSLMYTTIRHVRGGSDLLDVNSRCSSLIQSVESVERVLALGEGTSESCRRLQAALQAARADIRLLDVLRDQRAALLDQWHNEPGEQKLRELIWMKWRVENQTKTEQEETTPRELAELLNPMSAIRDESLARALEYLNRGVEAAKLPPGSQHVEFNRLRNTILIHNSVPERQRRSLRLAETLPICHIAWQSMRTRVALDCGIVGLACERFRLANGRWPDALGQLVPDYLDDIPVDQYTVQPLKLKRRANGIVIYSVGEDGKDNNGAIMGEYDWEFVNKDLGFRLWDPQYRRMLPLPPKSEPQQPVTPDEGGPVPPG